MAKVTEKHGIYLVIDQTYRGMSFTEEGVLPVQAGRWKHVISVSSMSKTYGLPGIRMGWVVTRDAVLMEKFLAAKESIIITNSIVDEEVADQFLEKRLERETVILNQIKKKFEIVRAWMEK